MMFANNTASSRGLLKHLAAYGGGPAVLTSFHFFNNNASTRYFMLFDGAALPQNGERPLRVWPVPTATAFDFDLPGGRPHKNGIVFAISTTAESLTLTTTDDGIMDCAFYLPPPVPIQKPEPPAAATPETKTGAPPTPIPAGRPAPSSAPPHVPPPPARQTPLAVAQRAAAKAAMILLLFLPGLAHGAASLTPGGSLRATNSRTAAYVLTTDGTNDYWAASSAGTASATNVNVGRLLRVDAVNGTASGTRGNFTGPWNHITNAILNASSGDVVEVGPGTFTHSNVVEIPSGVTVRGVPGRTFFLSFVNGTNYGSGIHLNGVGARLENVYGIAGYSNTYPQSFVGADGFAKVTSQSAFTNGVVKDCGWIGDYDGIVLNHSNACSLTVEGSYLETRYDVGLMNYNTNHLLKIVRSSLVATGTSGFYPRGYTMNGVKVQQGRLEIDRCTIYVAPGIGNTGAGIGGPSSAFNNGENKIIVRNSQITVLNSNGVPACCQIDNPNADPTSNQTNVWVYNSDIDQGFSTGAVEYRHGTWQGSNSFFSPGFGLLFRDWADDNWQSSTYALRIGPSGGLHVGGFTAPGANELKASGNTTLAGLTNNGDSTLNGTSPSGVTRIQVGGTNILRASRGEIAITNAPLKVTTSITNTGPFRNVGAVDFAGTLHVGDAATFDLTGSFGDLLTANGGLAVVGNATIEALYAGSVLTTNGLSLGATNGNHTLLRAPGSNSVPVTNIFGILHKASASVIELNANQAHNFTITNRLTAATTLVVSNTTDAQEISIVVPGEASGGSSRTLTLIANLGHLVADLDTYGTALATSTSMTLTNGNGVEISWAVRRVNGTNLVLKASRQFRF